MTKQKEKQEKNKTHIELSQTLTMNAAQDIKILNIYLSFGRGCIQKMFAETKSLAKYKLISNLQRKSNLEKTKIKHNFHWLKNN